MTSPTLDAFLNTHVGSGAPLGEAVALTVRRLASAAVTLCSTINQGPLGKAFSEVRGNAGPGGDVPKELDVLADALFIEAMRQAPVCLYASEELEEAALLDPAAPLPELSVRVGDALDDGAPPPSSYDVVVGNPPFLNQLERATAQERSAAARVRREDPGLLGPYTDLSAVFLVRAARWVAPGGRVALVQPSSLLAARDAAGVRARLAETCVLESLWSSEGRAFDASVHTCAPVLRRRAADEHQGEVARSVGVPARPSARVPPGDLSGSWGHLVAASLGVPSLTWSTRGVLGDVAEPGVRLAFLRSRPGGGTPTSADRAWARALYAAGRRSGTLLDVVHLAHDHDVMPLPMDDLLQAEPA